MIRISSGIYAGRVLAQPKTAKTRPMLAKVRESIFDRLGDVSGLSVLDAYAGSGAVGIEALSRGAAAVTFIEFNQVVKQVIIKNLSELGVEQPTKVIGTTVAKATVNLQGSVFDIIIADPPYAELNENEINDLTKLLSSDGILVVSHSSRDASPYLNIEYIDARTYGDTTISYYRRQASPDKVK